MLLVAALVMFEKLWPKIEKKQVIKPASPSLTVEELEALKQALIEKLEQAYKGRNTWFCRLLTMKIAEVEARLNEIVLSEVERTI